MKVVTYSVHGTQPVIATNTPITGASGTNAQAMIKIPPIITVKISVTVPIIIIIVRTTAPTQRENSPSNQACICTLNDPRTLPADICLYGEKSVRANRSIEK